MKHKKSHHKTRHRKKYGKKKQTRKYKVLKGGFQSGRLNNYAKAAQNATRSAGNRSSIMYDSKIKIIQDTIDKYKEYDMLVDNALAPVNDAVEKLNNDFNQNRMKPSLGNFLNNLDYRVNDILLIIYRSLLNKIDLITTIRKRDLNTEYIDAFQKLKVSLPENDDNFKENIDQFDKTLSKFIESHKEDLKTQKLNQGRTNPFNEEGNTSARKTANKILNQNGSQSEAKRQRRSNPPPTPFGKMKRPLHGDRRANSILKPIGQTQESNQNREGAAAKDAAKRKAAEEKRKAAEKRKVAEAAAAAEEERKRIEEEGKRKAEERKRKAAEERRAAEEERKAEEAAEAQRIQRQAAAASERKRNEAILKEIWEQKINQNLGQKQQVSQADSIDTMIPETNSNNSDNETVSVSSSESEQVAVPDIKLFNLDVRLRTDADVKRFDDYIESVYRHFNETENTEHYLMHIRHILENFESVKHRFQFEKFKEFNEKVFIDIDLDASSEEVQNNADFINSKITEIKGEYDEKRIKSELEVKIKKFSDILEEIEKRIQENNNYLDIGGDKGNDKRLETDIERLNQSVKDIMSILPDEETEKQKMSRIVFDIHSLTKKIFEKRPDFNGQNTLAFIQTHISEDQLAAIKDNIVEDAITDENLDANLDGINTTNLLPENSQTSNAPIQIPHDYFIPNPENVFRMSDFVWKKFEVKKPAEIPDPSKVFGMSEYIWKKFEVKKPTEIPDPSKVFSMSEFVWKKFEMKKPTEIPDPSKVFGMSEFVWKHLSSRSPEDILFSNLTNSLMKLLKERKVNTGSKTPTKTEKYIIREAQYFFGKTIPYKIVSENLELFIQEYQKMLNEN